MSEQEHEPRHVVPMIHVPDVRATVDWYQSIGFRAVVMSDVGSWPARCIFRSLVSVLRRCLAAG